MFKTFLNLKINIKVEKMSLKLDFILNKFKNRNLSRSLI